MRVVLGGDELTYGYGRKEDRISLAMLVRLTGIWKDALLKVVKRLEAKRILLRRKDKNRLILAVQKDYEKRSFRGDMERQLPFCRDTKRPPPKGHKKTTPMPLYPLRLKGFRAP